MGRKGESRDGGSGVNPSDLLEWKQINMFFLITLIILLTLITLITLITL